MVSIAIRFRYSFYFIDFVYVMYISVFIIIQIFRNCFNSIISFDKLNKKGVKGVIVSLREYFIYNNMLCLTHLGEMRVCLTRALIHFTFLCIFYNASIVHSLLQHRLLFGSHCNAYFIHWFNLLCCTVNIGNKLLSVECSGKLYFRSVKALKTLRHRSLRGNSYC